MDPFMARYILRRPWPLEDANAPTSGGAAQPSERGVAASRKPWWLRRILDAGYRQAFRWTARRNRYDVYHEPNHIPVRCDVPTVTTIHDLSVVLHPEWHPADRVRWYEAQFGRGVENTTRFIAASRFTKRQVIEHLGVLAGQIDVTYQAPRAAFRRPPGEVVSAVLDGCDLPEQFFLFVGTLEPRKNVEGLITAYGALPDEVRCAHPLVIAGAWGWRAEQLREMLDAKRQRADQVRMIGYVTDGQLAGLYAACTALVWPTWYEGFGLPPLEAMACGAAVVTSNVASLPEVVGEAGVLLDPATPEPWTDAMRRLVEDAAWRHAVRQRCVEQAARFSWGRCAAETVACYQRAAGSR